MTAPAEIAHGSAGPGGFDLLRRATQAMMSRTAADNEGTRHLGFDTPRSGVATPQPAGLQDRRLPGIMSYFGQVRPPSLQRLLSGTFGVYGQDATPGNKPQPEDGYQAAARLQPSPTLREDATSPTSPSLDGVVPLLPHEMASLPASSEPKPKLPSEGEAPHPYPTPPQSQRGSVRLAPGDGSGGGEKPRRGTISSSSRTPSLRQMSGRRSSLLAPITSTVEASAVQATPLHRSAEGTGLTSPPRSRSRSPSSASQDSSSFQISAVENLKRLTNMEPVKSGNSTPNRALSSTSPPSEEQEVQEGAHRESGEDLDCTASNTPTPAGSRAAKGKLNVKILEARCLKKCRDPYVVAVFQRNELISAGPRPEEIDDEAAMTSVQMGGLPIQRQGSDSGRPPMAIPMRSRQSSHNSMSEDSGFRSRSSRQSFTNPKWDAEAIFDVVDGDMLVDISVYGCGLAGEEFLGHVDFQAATSERSDLVRGWFPLKGHVDTMADKAPTGEIYVEASYQRAERRHFGPQDFQILRLIGKGTFGQVYQVRKKDTKRIYAMKVLSKKVIFQKKEVAHTVGERNILVRTATAESPFIVGLKFSFQTPSDLYLVTDYMSGGELFWHLQKEGRFDEKRAKFYIAELILAIEHLHKNDIVYRDLKPENILLDANGHIALCDFGLSKANLTKNDTTNTFCGTTEYLAPEVLLDEAGYTKMVDFWSLGVLVFEMCCGWSPFYAEDTQQMYKNIAFGKVRFPRDTLSLDGRNFVKGLLNRNPKHRLGATDDADELQRHAFFSDIDWEALSKKLITPPFKPQLKNETDVSYFDPEFTNAMNQNGSLNERAAQLAKGYAASTPLSPSVQANFQGFTFVDESALDEHMKDHYGNRIEDEEMDDASSRKHDDDWDEVSDANPRNANRMSGIVKTNTNDETVFAGTKFDI